MIYLLILHDYTITNPNTKVIFPYKIKQTENDIEIKFQGIKIKPTFEESLRDYSTIKNTQKTIKLDK